MSEARRFLEMPPPNIPRGFLVAPPPKNIPRGFWNQWLCQSGIFFWFHGIWAEMGNRFLFDARGFFRACARSFFLFFWGGVFVLFVFFCFSRVSAKKNLGFFFSALS